MGMSVEEYLEAVTKSGARMFEDHELDHMWKIARPHPAFPGKIATPWVTCHPGNEGPGNEGPRILATREVLAYKQRPGGNAEVHDNVFFFTWPAP